MVRLWLSLILAASLPGLTACNKPATPPNSTPVPASSTPSTGSGRTDQAGNQTTDQASAREANAAVLPAASDSAADAPDTSVASDHRPKLVCFGDSLTAGFGTEPGESYPDVLQRNLDQAGYKYRVVNEGISGNTTKDGLSRIARVIAMHPALVVVEFGGNDGLRGLPIADTRANLDTILHRLKDSGALVAIAGITLPPSYGSDYVQQFNSTYTLLAARYKAPMIPFLLQGAYGVTGMMQADNVHATARGNIIVAATVQKLVQPLLKK